MSVMIVINVNNSNMKYHVIHVLAGKKQNVERKQYKKSNFD